MSAWADAVDDGTARLLAAAKNLKRRLSFWRWLWSDVCYLAAHQQEVRMNTRTLSLLLLVAVALAAGCERTPPSPWKEMTFPLDNAEILPGASAEKLTVMYRNNTQAESYIREYKQSIEDAGYKMVKDGRDHDPTSHTYVHIFQKGEDKLRFSLQGGDGNLQVQLKVIDD